MQIINLKLQNFRRYEKLSLSFSDRVNILYGKNGSGKTNIVESIYFLALSKSFKNCHDENLITYNQKVSKVEGTIRDDDIFNFKIILKKHGKIAMINNNKVDRLSDYISKLNVVVFQNDDLKIIKDSPSIRRKELNIGLSQCFSKYVQYLAKYNKLLKQRNNYLKVFYVNSNQPSEYLEIINEKMASIGIKIFDYRKSKIKFINDNINRFYKLFSNNQDDELKIEYISDFNEMTEEGIILKYNESLSRDLFLKKTSFGIHHDDIVFLLNDKEMKNYCSEGQQKNAIISYKYTEIEWIKSIKNKIPILIMDDLFGELDSEKITNIMSNLPNNIQTFITTTEIDFIEKDILKEAKIFNVNDGKVGEYNYE